MADDQQQFDNDDYTGLDGQNGENFEQQEPTEQAPDDGGDQAMETGGEGGQGDDRDNEDDRKLFVGGLSWETTTKDLREYFEKFGEVTSCTLKTDPETRQSRGFGFVVFAQTDTVGKVLEVKEHKLHGRTIDPKQANPRQGIKKIFVGRLDPGVPEEEVKEYFGKFGTIAKIDFPFDRTKDQRRAFCFVEFEADLAVKKVLEQQTHKLGGQEVDIKKATPNNQVQQRGGRGGRGWGPGFGGRGGRGGRGGWNQGGNWNQGYGGYGGYGSYGNYNQGGYGNYGGYGGYSGYGNDYYGYGQGGWGGYDQGYGYGGYGGYDYGGWGYGQEEGSNSSYGKAQKRGGHSGGYHPYNR
ncbi:hypothetical protein C0Q70_01796 [Pomacea canaliculata]|uniref:RRM domain-containing protein n=1 Tax=Pomacea canaliculata TaxID=400727 RepID=A0A2T7Q0I0_POMCA|nr:heterogeneous nuclear ribonucleoprotein D-like [Pomacea canaliculata]PVD39168.1 hypothetical protein C0Q70_01796 [Pomacea canaliculata]